MIIASLCKVEDVGREQLGAAAENVPVALGLPRVAIVALSLAHFAWLGKGQNHSLAMPVMHRRVWANSCVDATAVRGTICNRNVALTARLEAVLRDAIQV